MLELILLKHFICGKNLNTVVLLPQCCSAKRALEIHHIDVVTAYLNGYLEENVYMERHN